MSYSPDKSLKKAFKPFDVVTDNDGNVGFISEVRINTCQPSVKSQLGYSVTWLVIIEGTPHSAWYGHNELESHCNLFVKIAEQSCSPHGNNAKYVKQLIA